MARVGQVTHGKSKTPPYNAWSAMRQRCYNPKEKKFKNYGGRGIEVCDRWRHSFENFYADMGERPSPKHTIERKNNNGNYEPDNCVWATNSVQNRNHRRNCIVTLSGRSMCLQDWANELGMKRTTLKWRLSRGWSDGEILAGQRSLHAA